MYGRDKVVQRILEYNHPPLIPENSVAAAILPDRYVTGGLPLPIVIAAKFGRLEVLKVLVQHTRERAAAAAPAYSDALVASAGRLSRSSFSGQPILMNSAAGASSGSIIISTRSVGGPGSVGYRSSSPSLHPGAVVDVFDYVDHAGYTLLHHAAVHGHLNVTQYLLGLDNDGHALVNVEKDKLVSVQGPMVCDKNKRTPHGRTPLILAVDFMRPELPSVERPPIVIASDSSADRKQIINMSTADEGRLKVFQALVEAGADLEERDGNGHTPLIVAANHGLIKVVGSLFGKRRGSDEAIAFRACLHDTSKLNQQTGG